MSVIIRADVEVVTTFVILVDLLSLKDVLGPVIINFKYK